ncbi:AzlD domain-containing protein [Undibacterium arcticum]|uniref:AzlD domain-containing protein n=1 Tax=Undibacterium arcticum TaxID=1762892 RepID=A0ABV7F0L7_9BURK
MSNVDVWISSILLAVAAILTRGSFFLLGDVKLPAKIQHALRYAPAAAMAAIVMPDLLMSGNNLNLAIANPKLWAALGAVLFFKTTRHLLGTIIIGMALYTVLRLVWQ